MRLVQEIKVCVKTEAGSRIEHSYFGIVDGSLQLFAIVHFCVPRGIALGTLLEILAYNPEEYARIILQRRIVVLLATDIVVWSRFRRVGRLEVIPTWGI